MPGGGECEESVHDVRWMHSGGSLLVGSDAG
jgi:hypothetical protein